MNHTELAVKSVLDSWNGHLTKTTSLLNSLTDEQLMRDIAPGRNSGTYILGHLVAVHDRMLPLLRFQAQKYQHLDDVFLASPDKSGKEMPSIAELRNYWNEMNSTLTAHFAEMQPEGWFERHNSVSEEDYAKEPHRNRLNVLISRTNHLAGHLNQLLLLK